jgi:hypothetical protein
MKVFILVRHDPNEDIFGSICVFNTLRVGFPTADVYAYIKHGPSVKELQSAVYRASAFPHTMPYDASNIEHYDWIRAVVYDNEGPIVFCDTDMIFYESVEDDLKKVPDLLAGRYIPPYWNVTIRANETDRLHTSLLYIKDCVRLRQHIANTINTGLHPYNPFAPFQYYHNGVRLYYDCCANLCHSFDGAYTVFTPDMLDKYTHLVSGTMLNSVAALLPGGERLKLHHQMAKENPESVRGLWREHDRFYQHYKI